MAGIKLEALTKDFAVDSSIIRVLDNISLNIKENQITVILGRSGCGKTTLLRIIGGLEKKTSGSIKNEIIKKTAFVFQEPRLMPWLNVEENISFGISKDHKDKIKLSQSINTVGLKGFEKAYPNQLSGGMQQRVSLARALIYNPSLILMDEPFAALDYFTREQMQKELIKVQKELQCGILFVTHSIDEALLLGDSIIILENGMIKQEYCIDKCKNTNRDLMDNYFLEIKKDIIKNLNL